MWPCVRRTQRNIRTARMTELSPSRSTVNFCPSHQGWEDDSFPSHTPPHSLLTSSSVLCTCCLWLRDCPDPASGMSSACTGLIGDGEELSRNFSWALETILIKSLHSGCNATCWNTNSFEDQWLLKKHSEQRSAYALALSSLPVFWLLQQRGAFKRKVRRQCFLYGDMWVPPATEGESMNLCNTFAMAENIRGSGFSHQFWRPTLRNIMAENDLVTHKTPWLLIFLCNIDMQVKSTISGGLQGWKSLGYPCFP